MLRSQSLGIDASQTAPSIIILQKAFPPAKPLPPKYVRNGAILGFLFLVLGVVGLVRPESVRKIFKSKTNRKYILLSCGGYAIVFFVLFGFTGDGNDSSDKALQKAKEIIGNFADN